MVTSVTAQEADTVEAEGEAMEQITITASKRTQTLQETPIAVSVTSSLDIEQARVEDIYDLQTLVPALRVGNGSRTFSQVFSIRGFGSSSSLGIEPSVGVFVDGVFRARSAGALSDLPKLERVEVLSGPQSTLFGKNASAGVISIVSSKPSFNQEGKVELTYGNYNQRILKGYVSGGISDDVAVMVSGNINKRDGYTKALYPGEPDQDNKDRWGFRGQALWEISTDASLRVIADYSHIDEICCVSPNAVSGPTTAALQAIGGLVYDDTDIFHRTSVVLNAGTNEIKDYGVSAHLDIDYGDFAFTSISAWRNNRVKVGGNTGGTSIEMGINFSTDGTQVDSFSQEFRFTSDTDEPLSWILGGFYYKEDAVDEGGLQFGADLRTYVDFLTGGSLAGLEQSLNLPVGTFFADGIREVTRKGQDNEDYSFFGTVDYQLSDKLTATVGLNYTRDKKEAFLHELENSALFSSLGFLANTGFGALQFRPPLVEYPNVVESGESDDSDTTYQVRLAYKLNENMNFYLSQATGFKSSSWDLTNFSRPNRDIADALDAAGINSSNPKYGSRLSTPEYSTVNEFGAKIWYKEFAFNLAVFQQSLEDFQVRTFDGVDFFQSNAGETSVDGFEFDLRYTLNQNWTFTVAGTYLDPVYDEFTNAPPGPTSPRDENGNRLPSDLSGSKPANIPEKNLTLGAVYTKSLDIGELYARADYQYESSVAVSGAFPEFTRQVNTLGLSAGLILNNNVSVQIWGRNVTDDENIVTVFGAAAQPGTLGTFVNQPRTYGVSLAYEF